VCKLTEDGLNCFTTGDILAAAGTPSTGCLLAAVGLTAAVSPSLAVVVHLVCAADIAWATLLGLCAATRLSKTVALCCFLCRNLSIENSSFKSHFL